MDPKETTVDETATATDSPMVRTAAPLPDENGNYEFPELDTWSKAMHAGFAAVRLQKYGFGERREFPTELERKKARNKRKANRK
jgi:hypothetical protein